MLTEWFEYLTTSHKDIGVDLFGKFANLMTGGHRSGSVASFREVQVLDSSFLCDHDQRLRVKLTSNAACGVSTVGNCEDFRL